MTANTPQQEQLEKDLTDALAMLGDALRELRSEVRGLLAVVSSPKQTNSIPDATSTAAAITVSLECRTDDHHGCRREEEVFLQRSAATCVCACHERDE